MTRGPYAGHTIAKPAFKTGVGAAVGSVEPAGTKVAEVQDRTRRARTFDSAHPVTLIPAQAGDGSQARQGNTLATADSASAEQNGRNRDKDEALKRSVAPGPDGVRSVRIKGLKPTSRDWLQGQSD